MSAVAEFFTFPDVVNEKAARVVAGGVVLLAVVAIWSASPWVALVMAIGFALRVASGPRFSPLGRVAARGIAPRLGPAVLVPGAPKRFAQSIGLAFASTATVLGFLGLTTAAAVVLGVLAVFATLESVLGFCAGCYAFGWLIRLGLVPEEVCVACNDIQGRLAAQQAAQAAADAVTAGANA